jgi:predicted dehydrogenase
VLVSVEQMYRVTSSVIPFGLPLFIEKPPGLTPEENERLVLLARRYSVPTMVGFNRRYYSIFHKAIQIVRQHGSLRGVYIEGHEQMWLKREGSNKFSEAVLEQWLFANSIHTIDLLRFFGGEPKKLYAIAHRYKELKGDQFAAIMEFAGGAIGQYSAYWYSPGGWKVVLYGDGVTVEFSPLEKGRWIDKNFAIHEIIPDDIDIKYKPGFFRQMEDFVKLIKYGKVEWPMSDLDSSYRTMILAEQIASNILGIAKKRGSALESNVVCKKE